MVLERMEHIHERPASVQITEIASEDVTPLVQRFEMSELPRLKVKRIPGYSDEVRNLDQAKDLPFSDVLIFAEGSRVNSYEELVQLATQDNYKGREFIEVVILPFGIVDGG